MITSQELTATILRLDSVIANTGDPLLTYDSTHRGPADGSGYIDSVPVSLLRTIYITALSCNNVLYNARNELKKIEDALAETANEEQ